MKLAKNAPLIIGLAIPVLMVAFIAASIYIPRLAAKPKVDFLYTWTDYNLPYEYHIENGKLVRAPVQRPGGAPKIVQGQGGSTGKLYRYSMAKGQAAEIALADAQKLTFGDTILSSFPTESPDGYQVMQGRRGGGGFFPFFFDSGSDWSAIYISGHGIDRKLPIPAPSTQNYYSFQFIGWILP